MTECKITIVRQTLQTQKKQQVFVGGLYYVPGTVLKAVHKLFQIVLKQSPDGIINYSEVRNQDEKI